MEALGAPFQFLRAVFFRLTSREPAESGCNLGRRHGDGDIRLWISFRQRKKRRRLEKPPALANSYEWNGIFSFSRKARSRATIGMLCSFGRSCRSNRIEFIM